MLIFLGGCAGGGSNIARSTEQFPQKTGFVKRTVTVNGVPKAVWVFIPPDYTPYKMYPAVLYLHGLFEQGNGGTNVLSAGLGPVIARNPFQWPFITIFPQSDGTWQGIERDELAMAALDDVEKHYMIDPDRVILAGLSYGGLGVWEIGSRHKDRFAALVPISGQRAPELAEGLLLTPVWAFASHGDLFVDSDNSREMCRIIQEHGGHAQFTELEGGEHDCWSLAVDQTELIPWMLNQRRNPLQSGGHQFVNGGGNSNMSGHLRAFDEPR